MQQAKSTILIIIILIIILLYPNVCVFYRIDIKEKEERIKSDHMILVCKKHVYAIFSQILVSWQLTVAWVPMLQSDQKSLDSELWCLFLQDSSSTCWLDKRHFVSLFKLECLITCAQNIHAKKECKRNVYNNARRKMLYITTIKYSRQ